MNIHNRICCTNIVYINLDNFFHVYIVKIWSLGISQRVSHRSVESRKFMKYLRTKMNFMFMLYVCVLHILLLYHFHIPFHLYTFFVISFDGVFHFHFTFKSYLKWKRNCRKHLNKTKCSTSHHRTSTLFYINTYAGIHSSQHQINKIFILYSLLCSIVSSTWVEICTVYYNMQQQQHVFKLFILYFEMYQNSKQENAITN